MIGLYDDDGNRLAVAFGGLTLNNPADAADDTYEINAVSSIQPTDGPSEARPADDGTEVYEVRKQSIILRLDGVIRAPSLAKLYDKKRALASAFDPGRLTHEDFTNSDGLSNLTFSVPTTNTTDYPTGLVASYYLARPRQVPIPVDSMFTGNSALFAAEVLVPDPRRYYQTGETLSGAGTANQKGDYRTLPTLTITMAGAGSATYAVTNTPALAGSSASTLTLDLSGRTVGQVVVVDMLRKKITVDGVETPSVYVSGSYFCLEPGNNVLSYVNTTNATSVLGWNRAWSI